MEIAVVSYYATGLLNKKLELGYNINIKKGGSHEKNAC